MSTAEKPSARARALKSFPNLAHAASRTKHRDQPRVRAPRRTRYAVLFPARAHDLNTAREHRKSMPSARTPRGCKSFQNWRALPARVRLLPASRAASPASRAAGSTPVRFFSARRRFAEFSDETVIPDKKMVAKRFPPLLDSNSLSSRTHAASDGRYVGGPKLSPLAPPANA